MSEKTNPKTGLPTYDAVAKRLDEIFAENKHLQAEVERLTLENEALRRVGWLVCRRQGECDLVMADCEECSAWSQDVDTMIDRIRAEKDEKTKTD